MNIRKLFIGTSVTLFLSVVVLVFYIYTTTMPLKINSYDTCFSRQFDITARYRLKEDAVEIIVLYGTLRHSQDSKESGNTDTIMFGLSKRTGKSWYISEKGNRSPLMVITNPGETKRFFLRKFSIPIDSSVNLSERRITLEAKAFKNGDESKPVFWYAHSDKNIFSQQYNDKSRFSKE